MVNRISINNNFKETDIGYIPQDWDLYNFGEKSKIKARIGWQGLTTKEYKKSGEYFLITGTDFKNNNIKWDTCHYVDKFRYDQDSNIQVQNNDILITKDGTIGKVAFVENMIKPATLNSGVFVIRPLNSCYEPKFLFYVLKSFYFDRFLKQLTAGSTINHLYQKDIVKFNFVSPPKDEQKAIATALSDMDDLILSLEKLISKKKLIKEGAMEELLGSKKTRNNPQYKKNKVGEICRLIKGQQFNQSDFDESGKYYVLNGGSCPSGFSEVWNTKENTISISEGGESCGFVNFNVKKFWSGGHCYTINNIASNINEKYLYYILKYNQNNIMKLRVGSGLPNIQKSALNEFNIEYIDSIIEQKAIAAILSDMDNEIEKLEMKLDKYKNIKSGMMEELLTGKRRLV